MPRLTPADATLILDHALGDASVPAAAAHALLAALPFPSDPTPRLRRAVLLRRLAAEPVSASALDTLHLLASLPASPAPSPIAAAHIAVAGFLAASAPDFDAAAAALFARPDGRARHAVDEGGSGALASDEAVTTVDQFEAAVGNSFSQVVLRGLWGDRAAAEERVRDLLAAEWAAIGPSLLEVAAERIIGDGAAETWRDSDEATRAKFRLLAGEGKTREILGKLEPTSHVNPISTPEVSKVVDALKTSCAELHSVVEDPLPAAKAAADEVLAARMDRAANLNAESGQPAACGPAGPSVLNENNSGPNKAPRSLMDWNPTAQTIQWEESPPDPEGSEPALHRPHLPSPRRIPVSPLPPADYKNKRRKARKWCLLEEETLRKGVELYGSGNWKDILSNNPDVFIGRTPVDLKDKWRNMMSLQVLDSGATQRLIPGLCVPFDFAVYMPLTLNINPKKYLQALFSACQNLADEASSLSSEQKEFKLYKQHVDNLHELAGRFWCDSVIICLGAKAHSLPELANKLPLRTCRVITEFQLPSDTAEEYGNQSPSISSDAWMHYSELAEVFHLLGSDELNI